MVAVEALSARGGAMSGYYHDQAATGKAFAGGWFHSRDLAVWHPDGTVELRDRGKRIALPSARNLRQDGCPIKLTTP
jgi:long-subunit acyl-CoA synthetase (AMP-forming)